jgi:hypothetical protein
MKNNTPYVSGDTYISNEEALRIYHMMEYTFDKGEFIKGMNVELEHQDVTDGSLVKTAMIAAAHLREVPNYYTLLLKYVEPKHEQLVGPDGTINGGPTPARVNKMKKSQLQKLIQEVIDEMVKEGKVKGALKAAGNFAIDAADALAQGAVHGLTHGPSNPAPMSTYDHIKPFRSIANKLTGTKKAKLKEYIREVLDEVMNEGQLGELSPETYRSASSTRRNQAAVAHSSGAGSLGDTRFKIKPSGLAKALSDKAKKIDAHSDKMASRKVASKMGLSKAAIRTLTKESRLKKYIQEVLDEVMNEGQLGELSPKKLSQYVKDAADSLDYSAHSAGFDSGERFAKGRGQNLNDKNYKKANKRLKGIATATDKLTKESRLGEEYYDRLSHSGRKAAQQDLEYKSAEHLRKLAAQNKPAEPTKPKTPTPSVKENTMPTLQEILMEGKENRVLLTKLTVLMEKLQPDFTKAQATKMMELCSETHQMVNLLNTLPYTIHNHMDWKVLKMGLVQKLMEVKVEAEKINSEKLNTTSFIKALDELIVQ